MQFCSLLVFFWSIISLNLASCSSLYEMSCNNSSECAVYPDVSQGPDVIWIPLFCNEKNICACPTGWVPLVESDICINKLSGSLATTCTDYVWAISFLVVGLLVLMAYSCASLFSRRSLVNLNK